MKAHGPGSPARLLSAICLEVEAQLRRIRSRRDEMRSAERGKEVVERGLVCQVDGGETQAPLVVVAVEEIVFAHAGVKQVARSNAGWIEVLIKRRTGDVNQLRALRRTGRAAGDPIGRGCHIRAAEEPDRSLLVRVKEVHRILESTQIRVTGH